MENALIIFVRNSEKGKVKKRLAKSIGDEKTLEVYKYLLEYTKDITIQCKCNLFVFYSHYIHINDVFDDNVFSKHVQEGDDIGERMMNAFKKVFDLGLKNICIIGSDCYQLETEILNEAFEKLRQSDIVIGPANDGGYYLVGMSKVYRDVFTNKDWGKTTLLNDTLETINTLGLTCSQLSQLNNLEDIDDLLQTDILTKLEEEPL
ncbi:TIGR04282 family arsenosugar biosynthesis glycosyltransferase [Segetibacter koreensis]|uniref:TIGR04282 family arsenosugar biosynthesis glycosyltransferase n=1 Tax=Segetibacter koreensis TaxID=398037 RepID=UPI0003800B27|nr:TIGR04282 family arsenosugar biosynthesis glycosyltransferase [Segetibacter koreensis]